MSRAGKSGILKHITTAGLLGWLSISLIAQRPETTSTGSVPAGSTSAIEKLRERIQARISDPVVARGSIGIKVVSLNSGTVIFEHNAEKYFMPASNMKNFTVAAALEKLTPDFKLATTILSPTKPDSEGTIKGDVVIVGGGDFSISYSFHDGDRLRSIDRVVDALIAAGVKRIDGNLIGDDSYFKGSVFPPGWEWDDLQWYYGAEVSALPVNDNVVSLSVKPSSVGSTCTARIQPFNFVMRVANRCMTVAAGSPRTLQIEKRIGENLIEISGELPVGNEGFDNNITVSRPAEMFASLLKQRLEEKGIKVSGRGYAVPSGQEPLRSTEVITRVESPNMAVLAARTMKPSQNMYTEVLLRTLGEEERKKALLRPGQNPSSTELGIRAVSDFLKNAGIPEDGIIQFDGSGLSRHNLVTPSAVAGLYVYMAKQSRYSQAWRESLTIGGVDGTLRNRFRGTRGEANVRGKTGTINQVSALSGYVRTAAGEELVFSMLVNGVPETRTRVGLIDEIVLMLANLDQRIDPAPIR